MLWNNPKATPQEILDEYGSDAAALFSFSSQIQTMATAIDAGFHPETWTNVSLGSEFNEAIFEGVLAALYRGQLFEKLRLNNKKITSRDKVEAASQEEDETTVSDLYATQDDKTVTIDNDITSSGRVDDDAEAMTYEFDKSFPEITKHAEAYEAEIAKLIENLEMDIETVLVEYRDI